MALSFSEWKKKKEQDKQGTSESSAASANSSNKTTSTEGLSKGRSFAEWKAERDKVKTSTSAQGWTESAHSLMEEVQQYYSSWRNDETQYNSFQDRVSELLSSADGWRKQYADNNDAITSINAYVDALSSLKNYAYNSRNYYSQWDSEDKYLSYMDQQKAYDEMAGLDLNAAQKEIEELERKRDEMQRANRQPSNAYLTGNTPSVSTPYGAALQNVSGADKEIYDLAAQISQKKAYLNQAKHLQEGIKLSSAIDNTDFSQYSGYVSTYDDSTWSKLTSQYGMGYGDLTYEYINNQNGIRDDIESKTTLYGYDTSASESKMKKKGYDHMTEDEVAIYNYYYAKEGKEKAQEYLDSIQEVLNHRKATERYGYLEGNTLLELAFGVEAGLDQFESGIKNLFNTEDDYIPQSAIQMASGMVREDLADDSIPMWYNFKTGKWEDKVFGSSLGQVGYDTITTTSNMLPSILTSTVVSMVNPVAGQIAGAALMGASAAGNAYQEMLNLGYDKGQARLYSALVGGSEAGLQYLLGGVGKLGGKLSGNVLTKLLDGVDNAFARTAIKLGGNMLSEGLEEGLQEILTPWFQNLVLYTDEDINWSEVAYSTLLGALTAGFMEGTSTVSGEVNTYKTGKQLQSAGITAQRLAEIGTDKNYFSADTVAYQLAGRVNENTGAYTMGRLFNEIGATLTEQNVNDITNALVEKNMPKAMARRNAEALAAVVDGATMTDAYIQIIEANEALAQAVNDVIINPNSTVNQRSQGYKEVLKALAKERATSTNPAKAGQKNAPIADTVDARDENGSEGSYEVDTSPSKAVSIASIEKGVATVKLEDGSTVKLTEADLDPSEGVRIETISKINGISVQDANYILSALRAAPGVSAQIDSLGAKEAYTYGFYGFPDSHMAEHGVFANALSETQRKGIYEAGRAARAKNVAAKQQAVAKNATTEKSSVTGKVHFDGDRSSLTERQSDSLTAMEKIADVLGVQIYVFESQVGANGKRIGANGWYDTKNNSIHIDLHAGAKGEGVMLFTLAHELTHHIRKWSPAKFKVLADFLMEEYGKKGVNIDGLVREQMAKAKRKGRTISYDTAYEEMVADSMEIMLSDGNVMNRLEKLKARDESLWHEIKRFINDLADKIRAVYKGITPDSTEGRYVADMGKAVYRLQELFAEALVDASDSFRAAQAQFSTDSIRGNADGAVAQSEVTSALVETDGDILRSDRTEYEALPKQVMSLSDGAGKILHLIEGLIPTKIKGLSGKTINGYSGRDVRAYAMGISGFTKSQINEVNKFMDSMAEFMEQAGVTYRFIGLQDVHNAKLHYTYNPDGSIKSIVLSAMVKNGDYPVNFDLSSICKKRVAMSKLIDKLAKRGSLDNGTVKLTPANIFKINTALKDANYETACLGCFVESKRYNSLEWAKKFCTKWNAAVKKANPNATYFDYGTAAFNEDSFTLEQAIKIDEAATKYITATKTERLENALKKYRDKEQAGLPLVESFSKAAMDRLVKSDTISEELKTKYLNCDPTTLNIADVEFLLENGILPGANLSNKQAVTEMVKSGEAYQHLLRPSDLLTDRGISKLEALPNFHGVLYGHYGSGTPKLMQSYTPYNSEIALLPAHKNKDQSLAEYLYSIAGVRMQSFSDFQIQNIYDYLQMVADLAARKVPAHAYTKEISFAKLLGMTGIKVNLSVMFDIDPMVDKAHAGLTKLNKLVHRGEYAKVVLEDAQGKWVYNIGDYQTQKLFAEAYPDEAKRFLQSIGFGDAVKLQSSTGYSANCGIIGVGYSDFGIFAMLNDNRIRYIIPYHASSLPAEIKVATNIALGTDYTPYQNNMKIKEIVDRNGNKVNWTIKEAYKRLGSGQAVINELNEKIRTEGWVVSTSKAQNGHGSYGLYEDLQQTNDPRQTASNFMDWCIGNSTLPLFYQFASHENYYKMLYDYNVYDCVTEAYAPQQAVTNTYPTVVDGQVQPGNVTDGGFDAEYFKGAIDKQMAFMDEYSRNLDEDLDALADNLEEGVLYSSRDYARQVDEVKNNTHDRNNHVYMGTTPTGIVNIIGLPKLPMLVTTNHIYSMAVSKQQAKAEKRYNHKVHYHDLGWDVVKALPDYINNPVLIIKSNTDPNDASFVVVTAHTDSNGRPIMAAIKPNGAGNYFNIEFPSNVMLSSYGRTGIHGYVARAKTENRILYANKNSQKQKNTKGVQFSNNILASDYSTNLAQFQKIVKSKFAGTIFENSGLPKFSDRDLADAIQGIEADVHTDDPVAIAEQVTDVVNTIKFSDRDQTYRDETYSAIGKELLAYEEGDMAPDLTLVETFNERTGKTETTIKHYGQKPKGYVPKRIAYCYKLFEQHPDGSLHALFAGARAATPIGVWQYAQGFPYTDDGVKGMNLRERYGWHLSAGLPSAPHLMSTKDFNRGYPSKNAYGHPKGSKRVWVRMAYDASTDFNSIADSTKEGDIFGLIPFGGYYAFKENNQSEWVISSAVKIDKILKEEERQQILRDAGYDEYEAWRKKHRATDEEKAANKRKSAENKKAKDKSIKAGLNYLSESSRAMREAIQSRIIDNPEIQYSDRDNAPTFYSHMARVVDGVKQNKLGAASVVSMLRGKGVKAEEIKWSGIEEWLDGKKSVTKAELQEFIAGSMLQIEEETLTDKEMPYSQEHLDQIAQYEAERDIIVENLKSEWKRIVGTDIPIAHFGPGLESVVVNKLLEANAAKKGDTEAGFQYKAAKAALQRCIEYNDHYFGFDNERQAFREAVRNPKDFVNSYEMSSFEKGVFRDFIKAQEAYRKVEGIPMQDQQVLKAIADSADRFSRRIAQVKSEHRAKAAKHQTKWGQYKLKGGENYREILFKIPGSSYYNEAMAMHWDERDGVLAHARIQDLNTFLGKMLFIEEIQSDWHNDGHKDGYANEAPAVRKRVAELSKQWDDLLQESMTASAARSYAINEKLDAIDEEKVRLEGKLRDGRLAPDAPFRDSYHEYVLKRLLRMAAEQGYDSIGWTPAEVQVKRWSEKYAEGYRIEYDQDIPKFLNKYGKKWGTKVGKTVLDNGTEVWSMAITDSMQESVLTEGQPLYSDRDTESVSNRSLLANAFEGVAQNDIERNKIQEYKDKVSLIEAEEQKLQKLNEQIKELSFAKGPKDTKKLKALRFDANQAANRINTLDKILLRLEASKPLQDVLSREKKLAYQRAEKKGKEALAAYKERAAKTQRELLDRWQESRKKGIESREKTAMRHKIQNVVKELNDLLLSNDKKRHVPENLKKAVADALALVNMDTVGAEERAAKYAALIAKETDPDKIDAYTVTMESILRQGEKMGQRLKELRDAYDEIQESDDPDIANAYDPVIAGCLKELSGSIGNTSLRNMSIEQLQDVYSMYQMVLTRVRDANKSFLNDKKESISNLASRVVGEIRRVGGEHKYRAAILDPVRKFLWNNLKPVYAFDHLGSDTLTEAFNGVRKGEDTWAKDVTEAREYYLDKSKKYGYDSWDFKKKFRFTSASELEFELTLEQVLSLYAYSKRNQAHDHLRLGGFVFDSNIETYKDDGGKLKYKVNTADAHQITPEILASIIGKLTPEQMGFVDEMQEYLSTTMGAKGNEVTMKMYGVKLFKEKFYFPLKSAKQFMFEQNEVSGEVKIKNSGFTNKVVAKANNPVILSNFMEVWSGHVNDMSMYHSFVLPLEDFNRIFNYNSPKKENQPSVSVKGTIQSAYSPAAVNYVKNLITDLNGGARSDSTAGIINKMMGLFKKGSVFASLSVVVQQPSAIARAAALVNTKYFVGRKMDSKRHKALWEEVKKYAPVAIIKEMGYFDTNMGKSTQDFILGKEYSGIKEKLKALVTDSSYRDEVLSKAPALADELAWCSIWEAVKREMHDKHPGLDVKAEPFLMLCGSRFTEVIAKTQVYDSILSRSANMRSKDTGMKMATAFMAEPTTSINMIADALLQGKRGNRKYARAAIGAVIASQIFNSILVSFVYAGRDDDEEETYWEKYLGTLTGEIIDSLNPLTYIPFIKDIMSIVQGYDVERSDMAVISDLWNAWQNLSKENVSVYRKVEGFAGSIAQIFGLPVKNIMRDVRGIYQTINSFINGEQTTKAGIGYAVKSALPEWIGGGDIANQEQLYEAYLRGDKEHLSRVKGRYADESAVDSAMRTAIKAHFAAGDIDSKTAISYLVKYAGMEEDDAYWKVEEWEYESETGEDFGKYNEFFTAVETGKNLKQVIKQYTDNGVELKTLSSQITAHFKPIYGEMTTSERARIKGYLLNAFELCGVNREDATKKLQYWEFLGEQPDSDLTQYQIADYYEFAKPAGISADVYADYCESVKDIDGDGKKERRMAVINSLPLTSAQKDALYFAEGWAESKLWQAPWH